MDGVNDRPPEVAVLLAVLGACTPPAVGPTPALPHTVPGGTEPVPRSTGDTAALPIEFPDGPPNFVVVVVDDWGVDKFDAYGLHPSPPPLPVLEALAAEGTLFTNAWATPSCAPSRATALTGRMPMRHGIGNSFLVEITSSELPEAEVTLPEVLAPLGYSSAAVGKWHLSNFVDGQRYAGPTIQGFDTYRGAIGQIDDHTLPNTSAVEVGYFHWERVVGDVPAWSDVYATTQGADDAIEALGEMQPPFFLWLALQAPHTPLHVPPASLVPHSVNASSGVDMYDAMLEALDLELGRVLAQVDLTTTTVVVFGDNGTPSHAVTPPAIPSQSKLTIYEGGIHVPLFVTGASVAQPGTRSEALVHIADLFPTLLELAGGKPRPVDGHSFVAQLADPTAPGIPLLFTERFHPNGPPPYDLRDRAARTAEYKLVDDLGGHERLYHLTGGLTDGPNLLASGDPIDPEAATNLDLLRAELARWSSEESEVLPPPSW